MIPIKVIISLGLILLPAETSTQEASDGIYKDDNLPEFTEPIPNITVAVGRDAQLPCAIDGLASYKAAWLRVEDKGILTIHDHIITRNYRISLLHADNKQFTLLIKNVQETDRGGYMCQVNTVPMRSQVGYLDVVFPPQILVNETSDDVVATEGANVTLTCKARGYPTPDIHWKREDKREIPLQTQLGKKYAVHNFTGETLTIQRVTRIHMGALLCIASNGIQPSVSRRVFLKVNFAPAVWIPNQSVGAPLGYEVTISCHIEAYPASVNYWLREASGEIIEDSDKYLVQEESKDYKTHLILTIRSLETADLGLYTCLAKNSLGVQEGNVKLREIPGRPRGAPSHRRLQKNSNQFQVKDAAFASRPGTGNQEAGFDEDEVSLGSRPALGLATKTAFVCLMQALLFDGLVRRRL